MQPCLRNAHVTNLRLPLLVHEHIIQLQFAVHHALRTQVDDGLDHNGGVVCRAFQFTVELVSVEHVIQVTDNLGVHHQEVKCLIVLPRVVELNDGRPAHHKEAT